MRWWSSNGDADPATLDVQSWDWEELSSEAPADPAPGRPSSNGHAPPAPAPDPEEVRAHTHAREVEDAFERGYAEGLVEGEARAREELAATVAATEDALEALRAMHARGLQDLEKDILGIALAVARQIVDRELHGDRDTFADLVRQALAAFPLDQPVRIRVNPEDLSRISAVTDPQGDVVPIEGGRDVRWIADPAVVRGGCVLDGRDRVLDGRIDEALERIYWKIVNDG